MILAKFSQNYTTFELKIKICIQICLHNELKYIPLKYNLTCVINISKQIDFKLCKNVSNKLQIRYVDYHITWISSSDFRMIQTVYQFRNKWLKNKKLAEKLKLFFI